MKKSTFLSLLLVVFFVGKSYSQGHLSPGNANVHITGTDFNTTSGTLEIVNTGNISLSSIVAERDEILLAPGHSSYFCWGAYCYGSATGLSPHTVTINPNDTNRTFIAYLSPGGNNPGTSIVDYYFYDNTGSSDTVYMRFTYDIMTTTGINEVPSNTFAMSSAYPNPADGLTSISYNLSLAKDSKIVFYNMLGSVVREIKLSGDRQKTLIIPISDFKAGVYYYSLIADGKTFASKKLVVTHK